MTRLFAIATAFWVMSYSWAAQGADIVGRWSKQVDGMRGRLRLVESPLPNSMRLLTVFIELENLRDVSNPITLTFDMARTVEGKATDPSGKPFNQAMGPADVLTPSPYEISLPHRGTLSFPVSVTGHAYSSAVGVRVLELSNGCWLVPAGESVDFGATFTVPSEPRSGTLVWSGKLDLPMVKVPHAQQGPPQMPLSRE